MFLHNRAARRATAFVLTLMLVLTGICFGGPESGISQAYGATEGEATVRILGPDNGSVITCAAVDIENGVTTVGAVVAKACGDAGHTFELDYGFPATIGGVTLPAGYYWMSMLNDSGTAFSHEDYTSVTVNNGDRIVLYADAYPSVYSYSYFTVTTNSGVSVMPWEDTSYITGELVLRLQQDVWGTVSPCADASVLLTDENGVRYSAADYGLPPNYGSDAVTTNSGNIKLALYGSCPTDNEGAYEKVFLVTSEEAGLTRPYCKVVLKANGMTVSQPVDAAGYRPEDPSVAHTADLSASAAAIIAGVRDAEETHADSYYSTDWMLAMAAAGQAPNATEKAIALANVLDLVKDAATGSNAGSQAKAALALSAWNIDATQVPDRSHPTGASIDLMERVSRCDGSIDPVYGMPFLLSLYDLGNYAIPADAVNTRESVIDSILGAQEPSGAWNASYGADATAMVLPALAVYYGAQTEVNGISPASCAAITSAVDKALSFLNSSMGEYGGFSGWGGALNANTQASVLIGLHALGIDGHGDSRFYRAASAMDNLISYETADCKLGYADNSSANDLASVQGMQALAVWQNLSGSRSCNLYHFHVQTSAYTAWPDIDLLTGISVTSSKTAYKVGEYVSTGAISVRAIYNGDASTATPVAVEACTVVPSSPLGEAGNTTVTVSYEGCSTGFVVSVAAQGTTPATEKVSVSIKGPSGILASDSGLLIKDGTTTALDVLKTAAGNAGISVVVKNGNYVSTIDGIGEFDRGANSGWLYSVNGVTPSTTAANEYVLHNGDTVAWYYTLDYTKDSSASSWSKENTAAAEDTAAGVATKTVTAKAAAAAQGAAAVTVSYAELSAAISGADKEAAAKGSMVQAEVVLQVTGAEDADSLTVTIPRAALSQLRSKTDILTVSSDLGTLSFDAACVQELTAQASENLVVTLEEKSAESLSNLSEAEKSMIGNRPVFAFEVKTGDRAISEFDGKVTAAVPYELAEGEEADAIVIYYVSGDGGLQVMKDCVYDPKTKTVTFTTDHFSEYAVGYHLKSFADAENHWAKADITFLAARGILSGLSAGCFDPDGTITRAQFAQILYNMSGAEASGRETGFGDVAADAWYAEAVAWAVDQKITEGTGGGSFSPDQNIARQDMAVMLQKYIANVKKDALTGNSEAVIFADDGSIASYAKDAVAAMQKSGIISGVANADGTYSFHPADKATRAQAAAMMAGYLR